MQNICGSCCLQLCCPKPLTGLAEARHRPVHGSLRRPWGWVSAVQAQAGRSCRSRSLLSPQPSYKLIPTSIINPIPLGTVDNAALSVTG